MKRLVFALIDPLLSCSAQSLKDCRTIFLQPMPESMDRFIAAEMVKWGKIKVVTTELKADCLGSFGRREANVQISSSGSSVVPRETSVTADTEAPTLPSTRWGLTTARSAAIELVHRESTVIVWANSQSDNWSWSKGPQVLARKLVAQLKRDYEKAK